MIIHPEKMALLESSLDLVRQKMKSYELFRGSIEGRLSHLESKCSVLASSSSKLEKQNLCSIDGLLSQSHVFSSSLKKAEGTALANLRKLEEFLGESLQEQQSRFLEVEERMLSMLSQKEKVLRNMTLELENHSHSIRGIQEWVKTDHNRGNSFTLVEATLRDRLEMLQKNNEMKLFVLEEKIKYLETIQESAATNRKKHADEREEVSEEINAVRKDVKRKMAELEERLREESERRSAEVQSSLDGISAKIQKNAERIQQLSKELQANREALEQRLNYVAKQAAAINSAKTQEREPAALAQRREQERNVQYFDRREVLTAPLSQERVRDELHRASRFEETYSKDDRRQQYETAIERKPLPPKKNLFAPAEIESPYEVERNAREMSGGIRGLLQKSKEKQGRRPQALSRQKSSGKGLPPVKEDPFAKKKKTENTARRRQESESQKEEVVYEIDEEGYLMDQEGNYLLNEHGEMIRLSPEEIQQYMDEGEND